MTYFKKQTGEIGEQLAASYLISLGYKVIDTNVVNRFGEIDLIVQKKKELHFVEIRTRHTRLYGTALESIDYLKINKIMLVAEALLFQNRKKWKALIPFISVVAIDYDREGVPQLEFLPDAYGL
ncbi:MAG: YraN family protein [bacterium]|nr:YraN family protein [bacterium]MBU1917137.1 YraN family protein [bacterium]